MADITALPPRSIWWGWGGAEEARDLPPAAERALRRELGRTPTRDHPPVRSEEVALPASRLREAQLTSLRSVVGSEHVLLDHEARLARAAGSSYRDLAALRSGDGAEAPDAVVLPGDAEEVAGVLEWGVEHDVAVVPFGGGTSVVGGVRGLAGEHSAVICLDLRRLDAMTDLDPVARTATLQAGMRGPAAEAALAPHGLTLGHLPQSHQQATIGGYAVTRSAGQASSGYGRFEDMVLAATIVTPRGVMRVGGHPGTAAGPHLLDLVLGSEGAFGVVTDVTVRVRPKPTERVHQAWVFPSFAEGAEAVRHLIQELGHGLVPDVIRLSDEEESRVTLAMAGRTGTALRGYARARGVTTPCLLILMWEGSDERVLAQRARLCRPALTKGGTRLPSAVARAWEHGRFSSPYLRDELMTRGIFVETLETATTWAELLPLKQAVDKALRSQLVGPSVVQTHISHVYETGASLYFTALAGAEEDPIAQWERMKGAASAAIVAAGGTITHHHAIGTDHRDHLTAEIGELGVDVLRSVKDTLDPDGVLNPGKLIPVQPGADRPSPGSEPRPAPSSTQPRAHVLVNPTAARGRAQSVGSTVRSILAVQGWDAVVTQTTSAEHAEELAASVDRDDLLVPVGGDGLLARVAGGAVRSQARVVPLPAGSGNDFVRALGLTQDPIELVRGLAVATERVVEVGQLGERVFLGLASLGYDTVANTIANETPLLRGAALYGWGGVRAMTVAEPHEVSITVDDEPTQTIRAWNVAIGSSGRYGGGILMCPQADLEDGLLDLVVMQDMPRATFAVQMLRSFSGAHVRHRAVTQRQVTRVRVSTPEPVVVFADGDPIGTTPIDVTVRPAALRLFLPADQAGPPTVGGVTS